MINNESSGMLLSSCVSESSFIWALTGKRSKCELSLMDQSSSLGSTESTYNERDEKYVVKGISLYALKFISKITKATKSKVWFNNSCRVP
jgi:hypothetical protein